MVSTAVIAAAISTLVVPAQVTMEGCNGAACLLIKGKGLHVDLIWVGLDSGRLGRHGHVHIWGGGIDMNTYTQTWAHPEGYTLRVGRDLPNRSVVCVQGWEHQSSGGVRSIGRACGEIKF